MGMKGAILACSKMKHALFVSLKRVSYLPNAIKLKVHLDKYKSFSSLFKLVKMNVQSLRLKALLVPKIPIFDQKLPLIG